MRLKDRDEQLNRQRERQVLHGGISLCGARKVVRACLPLSTRKATSSGINNNGTPKNTFCWERWGRVPAKIPQIWCLDRRVAISALVRRKTDIRYDKRIFLTVHIPHISLAIRDAKRYSTFEFDHRIKGAEL
ncbi:hypothetical protein SERLADRAFT_475560, partial [Serpula lacrymans var. lacrymans S7.9]